MRIAIICPEFPPHTVGGGGIVVEHLARSLAQHNLVDVVFGSWNRSDVTKSGNPSLTPAPLIHPPGIPNSLTTSMPPTRRGLVALLRLLRKKPDIAHLHGVGHPIVDIAAMICKANKIPYVQICHGLPLASNPHPTPTRLLYRAYEQLVGLRTLKNATFVIAISNRVARSLKLKGIQQSKIRTCYPILESESTDQVEHNFKDVAHIPPETKVILFLGSISYRKGADLAVEMAASLRSFRSDFVMCLLGHDGGMMDKVLRRIRELNISNHVRVSGYVPSAIRDSALQSCDLVIFPSRDEPYGLVPLEAIAHKKPVLVSIHSGVAELLKGSELLFDPLQTESAGQRINMILDSPDIGKRLVKEASTRIEATPAKNSDEVYEELSLKSSVTLS